VYGTLKKGFGNHFYLERARFLGKGETVEKYALYELEIPYVVKNKKVSTIKGEVYEVERKDLIAIDRLENHPWHYKREKVRVKLEDGREVKAWIYFINPKSGLGTIVQCGRLNESGEYKG